MTTPQPNESNVPAPQPNAGGSQDRHSNNAGDLQWESFDFPGMTTLVIRAENVPADQLPQFMDSTFQALGQHIGTLFTPTGPAFSRYDAPFSPSVTLEAGFPIGSLEDPNTPSDEDLADIRTDFGTARVSQLPARRIAIAKHRGPYDRLGESWTALVQAVQAAGEKPHMPYWEAYDTEPTPDMNPEDLITGLALPLE